MRKVHLICNAHLDPVWLWQRTEGMAEAMATFRIAADFCEKYDGFVFNHNESVLYEWVMEHDPILFDRIKKLAKQGKWRIMGGWYLQPDVLMPNGESIIRQIRVGNEFFEKHFGEIPKTSINFDSFGHSRGLAQILKNCGYENYAYMRPRETECGPFIWKGFDGSEINAFKLYEWYNTPKGEALVRLKQYDKDFPQRKLNAVTWGIGNHGGGPSKKDLEEINAFAAESADTQYVHSDFDTYFEELDKASLETVDTSLTHCMMGCYTSMVRIKQSHRQLENRLSMCEKMLWQSGVEYDKDKLAEAEKALLFCEFHDILPGSAIKKAEEDSLRLMGYGDEIIDKYIAKAFFKLCDGQKKAVDGEIPILIYNPHPYPIESDFETEFQLAEQNAYGNPIFNVRVKDENGGYIPSQLEQEASAHPSDWRKKIVFHAAIKPMSMARFDCELKQEADFVMIQPCSENRDNIVLKNDYLDIEIDKQTGEFKKYLFNGKQVINSIKIKTYADGTDPWGMAKDGFYDYIGEFKLKERVNVIENGVVRTKIQTVWEFDKSSAVITYTFSKTSKRLDVNVKMLSAIKNVVYKLCIDTALDKDAKAYCQSMFGTEETHKESKESVFQKWCGLNDCNTSIDILNDGTYGGSFNDNEIQITLLRTPVYAAHPINNTEERILEDREYDHIDMGERYFDFGICIDEQFTDCEAEVFNQKPYTLAMFPSGNGEKVSKAVELDNKKVILSALRDTENGTLVRVYNSVENEQDFKLKLDGNVINGTLSGFEVKTYTINGDTVCETDMLGR